MTFLAIGSVVLLVLIDQFTKIWAFNTLSGGGNIEFLKGILSFEYLPGGNTGGPWGIFSEHTWILLAMSIILIGIGLYIILFKKYDGNVFLSAVILILAGGIGNQIDRFFRGFVIDFLKFDFINFPYFNIADTLVCVGVGLLFIYVFFIYEYHPAQAISSKNNSTLRSSNN